VRLSLDNRETTDKERFDNLLGQLSSKRLTYRRLDA
jgi:hypothetical protein